jgi:7,8-dihydropterin-6-yl-methyl-4-(beta-D-ribofuranosyl)aminobenzene 5'-phosphate synthase
MNKEFENSKIREADGVEIISLVDNSIDLLSTINHKDAHSFRQWTKTRYGEEWIKTHSALPKAEHGFSMFIRVLSEGKSNCILFDTGISPDGIIENAKRLGVNLNEVECIVLSHGHYDHFGGLLNVIKAVGKVNLPIIVHEDMFKTRGAANQNTVYVYPAFPSKEELSTAQLTKTKQPQLFINDMLLVTGEIPRETSFEKGFLQHKTLEGQSWKADPRILDDRAIALQVKGKGLIVMSGCAHAGIINTIRYVQKITGVTNVYAVLGGFHLAGKENEGRIKQTVKELKQINPKLIAPAHCTGWRGTFAIANALSDAFVFNSVGNLYNF